jgi:hypothetical protein
MTKNELRIKRNDYRRKCIANGKCANCGGRTPVFPHTECKICLAMRARSAKKRYIMNIEKERANGRRKMKERKESGLCTGCGAPLSLDYDNGYVTCVNCRCGLRGSIYYATNNKASA